MPPVLSAYEYAIIRVVPRVERGEFINAGAILFCRTRRFLGARIELDAARLAALAPWLDIAAVERHLALFPRLCAGDAADPIGRLDRAERFRCLVAPSSTIIQPSPVHTGLCRDPAAELERLLATMVRPPAATPAHC
jgi:hypothetical protein